MKREIIIPILFVLVSFTNIDNAGSQINSYPVNQTISMYSGSFLIDADNDSHDDYTFQIFGLSGGLHAARVISLGNSRVMDSSTFGYPDTLNFGDDVTGPYSSGNAVLGTDVGGAGQFTGAGLKYLGLNIDASGESHLGWISLEVSTGNDTIILHDIGYNTISNGGITAGQMNPSSVNDSRLVEFAMYPNPCQNILGFDWPGLDCSVRYSISDLSGKLVLNGASAKNIDVSVLAPGTYILTIAGNEKIGKKKFTKN